MKFKEWFDEQFDDYSLTNSEKARLQAIVMEGMDAQERLNQHREWEIKRYAALYACR